MGLFKSEEEKAAQARERAVAEEAARRQRMEQTFASSVIGRARQAFADGDRYFQAEISPADMRGEAAGQLRTYAVYGPMPAGTPLPDRTGQGNDLLSGICDEGWRLLHAGWVHAVTQLEARGHFFDSSDRTYDVVPTQEVTVGMFLFERDEAARVVIGR